MLFHAYLSDPECLRSPKSYAVEIKLHKCRHENLYREEDETLVVHQWVAVTKAEKLRGVTVPTSEPGKPCFSPSFSFALVQCSVRTNSSLFSLHHFSMGNCMPRKSHGCNLFSLVFQWAI